MGIKLVTALKDKNLASTETLQVFEITSPEEIEKYKRVLREVNHDWPYHRFELLNVRLNPEAKLICFVFERNGEPLVLMPIYLRPVVIHGKKTDYFDVSSPWGYTGPLFKGEIEQQTASAFWSLVDQWYHDNKVVSEFIRFNFLNSHLFYSGTVVHTLFNVKGELKEDQIIWDNLQSKTKNKIRNAYKNDLEFSMFHGDVPEEKVKEFYDIYISTMDRNEAVDSFYHEVDYFQDFVRNNPDCCAIGLVYKDGKAISTELFLLREDTIFSFLGGTFSDYFRLRPNDFLKMETIKWARDKGLKYYVIGGG